MADPAFLLYSNDFLTGTFTMSNDQVGLYIRLLCLIHQNPAAAMAARDFEKMVGSGNNEIREKFETETDESGNVFYFNARLRAEAEKRANFCQSRRNNRLKKTGKTSEKHMSNETVKIKPSKIDILGEIKAIFNNENPDDLLNAWNEWEDYKNKQFGFRFKTDSSKLTALKTLKKISNGEKQRAIQIIEQSIANGWRGLFPIKSDSGANDERFRSRVDYANRHN